MKTFRLLSSVSCAVILVCASIGTAGAVEESPIVVETISGDDLSKLGSGNISELLYAAPSLSVFGGSAYAPELGGGIKIRGIGDPRFNLSIEGSAALYQPGSVGELWVGSRLGFVLDEINKIEIVGSSSVGLIGGTPSYRFGVGGEIPVLPNTDLFVEGVMGGHIGFAPTDNGVRAGLHFFPGRIADLERIEVLKGPRGTLFGDSSAPAIWVGGSMSFVPSASRFIPAVDGGVKFKTGTPLDIGLKASVGYEVPAGDYSVWGGIETGYQLSSDLRAYLSYELGSIGGFSANKLGIGGEYKWDPNWSATVELSGRGAPGSFSEGVLKTGLRYTLAPESDWDEPITIDIGPSSGAAELYVGKSLSVLPSGYVIPSIDAGVTFPLDGDLDFGLRGQLGYVHPVGDVAAWGGFELDWAFGQGAVSGFGYVDVGIEGGTPANRVGIGGKFDVNSDWAITVESFKQGPLGTLNDYGFRAGARVSVDGLRHAFEQPAPPP